MNFRRSIIYDSEDNILNEFVLNKSTGDISLNNIIVDSTEDVNNENLEGLDSISLNMETFAYQPGYKVQHIRIHIGKFMTAAGGIVLLSQFMSILMLEAGTTAITMGSAEVIRNLVVDAVSYGGSLINKYVVLEFHNYWGKKCRGSECFEGYYNQRFQRAWIENA